MICGAWMCACVLKKHYVMWVGGAALSKNVLFLASVHSKLPLGTLSLAFFDSLYAQGLSSVPNDSYIRSSISHDSQKFFKTVFKQYIYKLELDLLQKVSTCKQEWHKSLHSLFSSHWQFLEDLPEQLLAGFRGQATKHPRLRPPKPVAKHNCFQHSCKN